MDTNELLKKITLGETLTEEEQAYLDNISDDTNYIYLEEGWRNTSDGVYKKINAKTERQICEEEITHFHIYKSNNLNIAPQMEVKIGNRLYKGTQIEVAKQLHHNSITHTKADAIDLLNVLSYNNKDKSSIRNDGGYLNLEDLPKKKPELILHPDLLNYLNACDDQQKYAFRECLLYGFVNILRKEAVKPRGLIKALILYGAKYSGKTMIVNIVRNMFTEDYIGFGDGGSPSSSTALRNSLANTIGIVMCDECDAKMVNKKRRTLYNDIEALIKGVYQKELPKTSDLNNQGYLLNQEQQGVPVMTMNDTVNLTEALKDRVTAIEFDNSKELPIIDLNIIKDSLVSFGKALAYEFRKEWENIKSAQNSSDMIDLLIMAIEDDYGVNLNVIFDVQLKNNQPHEQSIIDCIRTHIKEKLDYHIVGNDIDNAFFNNWVKFDWILKVTTKEVILHQKKFNNFVKSNDCLNDGGISSQKIGEKLKEETGIEPVKKMRTINGKTMGTIAYSYQDFAKMMSFTVQEEEVKE